MTWEFSLIARFVVYYGKLKTQQHFILPVVLLVFVGIEDVAVDTVCQKL
jgi:hypothetical protein